MQELVTLRKELHKNPELSGQETETASRIRKFIETHHPTKIIDHVGGTSLLAIYDFGRTGSVITIRCELDALPIEETNQFDHRSINKGIAHKCGHDGHMAIVAGLIFWIKEQNFNSGKIILLFQASEENGKGAERVLQDEKFQALNTDYIFALHNIPQKPMHSIITMDSGFSAEVQSLIIKLKGVESHAAEPDKGINPSMAIAEIIKAISDLNVDNPLDENFAVLTPVHLLLGQQSYGISPANGELHYTIRTWGTEQLNRLKTKILQSIEQLCIKHKLAYEVNWLEYFPASTNHLACNKYVKHAAMENEFKIIERPYPFKFGEDFGWYTDRYKCAMFGLGSGIDTPPLHHAHYDFPDEIIETGIDMFKTIIKTILNKKI